MLDDDLGFGGNSMFDIHHNRKRSTSETDHSIVMAFFIAGAIVLGTFVCFKMVLAIIDSPYKAHENSLTRLQNEIKRIDSDKYADENDWLFSIHSYKVEYDSPSSYYKDRDVIQENEIWYSGTYDVDFEKLPI